MKALLAAVSLAVLAGSTAVHADTQYVQLTINNKTDVNIQVDVLDKVGKSTNSISSDATPGGTLVSKAMLDDSGMANFTLSIVYRDPKGSYYRCWDVSTNPNGSSELQYDVTTDSGRSC